MHIPNGFLDPKVSTGTAFAAAAVLGYCIAKLRQALSAAMPEAALAGMGSFVSTVKIGFRKASSAVIESHFAKMGAIGSLILASQMFNFPITNGTSGHLLGGILAAVALGPFSGAIVISAILLVQSIFLGDGGLAAIGANILNMAVVGSFGCYYIYYVIHKAFKNKYGYYIGIGLASFFSVLLSSILCAFEISLSGTIAMGKIVPAMASVHSVIGIAEAMIMILALEALRSLKFGLEGKLDNE